MEWSWEYMRMRERCVSPLPCRAQRSLSIHIQDEAMECLRQPKAFEYRQPLET